MNDRVLEVLSLVRRVVDRITPESIRPRVRNEYQKIMLRMGHDALGEPQQHHDFLELHLGDLRRDLGGRLGDYVEFGVYQGASMAAAVRAGLPYGMTNYYGFDSFEGLPAGSEDEGWGSGRFQASLELCRWNLRRLGVADSVTLIPGWFEDSCVDTTTERHGIGPVSVVMLDCDIYSASKTALEYIWPLVTPCCLVVFDDWFGMNPEGLTDRGQPKLFSEFTAAHPDVVVRELGHLGHAGQAFRMDRTDQTSPQ
jgi:hypothetical protein